MPRWTGGGTVWYDAGSTGQEAGAFDGLDLGTINSLTLGGQIQSYGDDDGETNPAFLNYAIDGGDVMQIELSWFHYENDNNWFQGDATVDLSSYADGESHSINVYFSKPSGDAAAYEGNLYESNDDHDYTATFKVPFTETQTTPAPVPYAWLRANDPTMADEYEAYEAAAHATAANGRNVWACYLLGLDLSNPLDDFRITSFRMEGDVPVFEFNSTTNGSGVSFLPYVKPLGKANLPDAWLHVPEDGSPAFRFFAAEVVPPGCASSVEDGVQLWENGPYWAECNVGATNPEEYGYYFWWGDTVGYTNTGSGWVSVKDGASISFADSGTAASTYGKDNSALLSEGWIDSTGNLVASHDAATAHLGEGKGLVYS